MSNDVIIKAEIERIRHHLDLYKKERQEDREILIDIKNVLVGNDLNKRGMVQDVEEIKGEIDELRDFKQEVNVYLRQAKFVIGGVVVALIGVIIKLFTK